MSRITLVVADAARARLFTFQPSDEPGNGASHLIERGDLVDPARRLRAGELLTETRPASNRAPTGRGFATDDHRDEFIGELDRRFAAEIMQKAEEIIETTAAQRLIIIASPHMLGLLRHHTDLLRGRLDIDETALDLTHETVPELQTHLTDLGLLPASHAHR
jgi:protein required for attachment to host cells